MPLEGHILRFTDFEGADYPVEQLGYIQAEQAFIGAVWLGRRARMRPVCPKPQNRPD